MCRKATGSWAACAALLVGLVSARAQTPALDWRHVGNSAINLSLPSVGTGPVDRVWYSPDGARLYARTSSGLVFATSDFEQWQAVSDVAIPAATPAASGGPELAPTRSVSATNGRIYRIGSQAYRSDDGGSTWTNLTEYKGASILGGALSDVVVSPNEPEEVVVANNTGVWRSVDGGLSWTGLNEFLPNLPAGRIVGVPNGSHGLRLSLRSGMAAEAEWIPGQKAAWQVIENTDVRLDSSLRSALSQELKRNVTAVATSGNIVYAGDSDGILWSTSDQGANWRSSSQTGLGPVEAIWVDATDARIALAAIGAHANASGQTKPTYVLRTMNGGIFWDDITANLPDAAAAHGVVADRASGSIYVATNRGVFYTTTDLASAGRSASWTLITGALPQTAAMDVALDAGANQIYVSLDGYGVYATMAPHRLRDPRVVNAADFSSRPAAPGSLLSVLGARVDSARLAGSPIPVLDAANSASQIQVPFEAQGGSIGMTLQIGSNRLSVGLPLLNVSPAIFVDPDGVAMILDADTGVMLDPTKPAHSNTRIQVLATGLGRVQPDWPTGVAAPLNDPPKVIAPISAYLDKAPVEVTRAVLSPYIGYYLIELQLPRIVNSGPAEFYIEADGQPSNRVRLYIEP